uniref:Uncharacterized protein n=1 Tax=Rhizophora mucronata TaxID=61149 RepID=A0A2P2PNW5_RHIMU
MSLNYYSPFIVWIHASLYLRLFY